MRKSKTWIYRNQHWDSLKVFFACFLILTFSIKEFDGHIIINEPNALPKFINIRLNISMSRMRPNLSKVI